jgi:putative ABC transport system permease protein
LSNVRAVDLGVDADHLIMAPTSFFDGKRHPELSLLPSVAERIRAIPGVDGVAYGTGGPFTSEFSGVPLFAPGTDAPLTSEAHQASYNGVSTNYFTVTRTPIIAGRGFLPSDQPTAAPVMVIGRALAESLWPGTSPIGKCVIPDDRTNPCYTIVGVAEDVHSFRIVEDKTLGFYIPVGQDGRSPTTLIVHVQSGDPHAVAALVRRQLVQTFPNASVNARVVADALVREVRPWRIAAEMFTALSLLALVVATVGIYSVVAFQARQRTREMAVRAALGARTSDLVRLVLGAGLVNTAIGVALGIAGALAGGRFVASLLYGVTPRDPIALGVASVVALAAGTLAGFGPAWRAGTLDPALVLRDE